MSKLSNPLETSHLTKTWGVFELPLEGMDETIACQKEKSKYNVIKETKRGKEIQDLKKKLSTKQTQIEKFVIECIPAWKKACAERDIKIEELVGQLERANTRQLNYKKINMELNHRCKYLETKKDTSISRKLKVICREHWRIRYQEWKKEQRKRKELERRIGHLFMGSANFDSSLKTWNVTWTKGRPVFGRYNIKEEIKD